jgi:hypothetical protein
MRDRRDETNFVGNRSRSAAYAAVAAFILTVVPVGPSAGEEAPAGPVTVTVGTGAAGSTIRYIGASGLGPTLTREAHVNVTKCWWSLAGVERELLAGDVRGRPTKKEVLEKGPEKVFDWQKVGRWYGRCADAIRRRRKDGVEIMPNVYPKANNNRDKGRWNGPGCPTTEEDWHEWWRGCFVMAYYFNVREKLNVRLWEIGCEPADSVSQAWRRRDGKLGSPGEMAKLVAVGADAIRTVCKYASVEPIIGGVGEFQTSRIIPWWEGIAKEEDANGSLDVLSFHSFWLNRHGSRMVRFNEFIAFSRAHPHPETGKPRHFWDTSWSARTKGKGRIADSRDLGYALMLMGKIIDQNETGFFDVTIVYRMHYDAPDHGITPGRAVAHLILKSRGPDGKKVHTPTVSYYALRMVARAMAGGKERLPVSGMPTTVEKGPDKPYESYEAGEECFLCTAGRDEESVFVTFLNATGIHRAVKLDLSALKLAGRDYVVRELSGSRNDEEVARGTMGAGPLDVASGGASALQVEVKR